MLEQITIDTPFFCRKIKEFVEINNLDKEFEHFIISILFQAQMEGDFIPYTLLREEFNFIENRVKKMESMEYRIEELKQRLDKAISGDQNEKPKP
jgi:hypothetical protein